MLLKLNKESTRIICYELNEIPESIIRFYIKKYPHSNFSKLLNSSSFFKTNVSEKRHLHPWSVWPTVHRVVASSIHKINFINQDKKSANIFPPIWEYLAKKDITVGVHGSLQSYPPFLNKNIKFFLPDTFAPEPSAHPLYLKKILAL